MSCPGRLKEKCAIVTGTGSGIGRATAKLFSLAGAQVGLIDRDPAAVEQAAKEIRAAGYEAYCVEVDLSDGTRAEESVGRIAAKLARIDVLVNRAATCTLRTLNEMTRED